MQKILIIADTHFRAYRLEDQLYNLKQIIDYANKEQVNCLLHLGDYFHDKNIISGKDLRYGTAGDVINKPLELFDKLPCRKIMILGNHDYPRAGHDDALKIIEDHGWKVIREISVQDLIMGVNLKCIPYAPHAPSIECLKTHNNRINIVVGHLTIAGVKPTKSNYQIMDDRFCFTHGQIEELKPNHVFLGHIHSLQEWYIGSAWQNNFGEAGNVTGAILLTIDGKKTKTERIFFDSIEYVSIPASKYKPEEINEKDHYIIRGEINEADLPENVRVEAEVEKIIIKERDRVDVGSSYADQFSKWVQLNAEDAPLNVLDYLQGCLPSSDKINDSEHDLTCIRKVKMQNIGGTHRNFEQDFQQHDEIIIFGENGIGKSQLLESPLLTFFGYSPSYGNFGNVCNADFGDAEIAVEFESMGKVYNAVRSANVGKTIKQSASLLDAEGNLLAGPKVKDFESAIQAIVGEKEFMLSSNFSSQGLIDDLIDAKPSERKDFFHRMLNIEHYKIIADNAKEKLSEAETELSGLKSLNEKFQIVNNTENLKEEIKNLIKNRNEVEGELTEQKSAHKIAEKLLYDMKLKFDTQVSKKRELDVLQQAKNDSLEILQKKHDKIENLKEILKQKDQIEADYNELVIKQEELKQVEFDLNENNSVKQKQQELKFKIEQLINQGKLEKQKLENEIKRNNSILEKTNIRISLLETAGCKPNFFECPFLDDAKKAILEKTNIENSNAELQEKIDKKDFAHDTRSKLTEAKKELAGLVLKDVDMDNHKKLKNFTSQASAILMNMTTLETAKMTIEREQEEYEKLNKKILDKDEDMFILDKQINLTTELVFECKQAEENESKLRTACEELSRNLNQIKIDISLKNGKMEQIEKFEIELEKSKTRIEELTEIIEFYNVIKKAFDKNGIPQLVISSALPEINAIIQELIEKTGVQIQLSIDTVRELKTGSQREDVFIVGSLRGNTRDVSLFSGGQRQFFKLILRFAISIYNNRKNANRIKVLWLDEPFRNLDAEFSMAIITLVKDLKNYFKQVWITSHENEYQDYFKTPFEMVFEQGTAMLKGI